MTIPSLFSLLVHCSLPLEGQGGDRWVLPGFSLDSFQLMAVGPACADRHLLWGEYFSVQAGHSNANLISLHRQSNTRTIPTIIYPFMPGFGLSKEAVVDCRVDNRHRYSLTPLETPCSRAPFCHVPCRSIAWKKRFQCCNNASGECEGLELPWPAMGVHL